MKIKTLTNKELEQINGGSPAHVAGAISGAVGGAASPIRPIHNIVVTAGTGIVSGGLISLFHEIRVGQAPK